MESLLLTCTAVITGLIIFIGRKRLRIALPCAFAFLLYAAILIPNILPPRTVSARNACVANLELIQRAKAEWAARNQKRPGDIPTVEDLFSSNNSSPYLRIPDCPNGGQYKIGAVNQKALCTCTNAGHVLPK